jgi:2-methylfumaryl-CoA isomerase
VVVDTRSADCGRAASGPLTGLKVYEISAFVAAPLGGLTLAQLGADVVRIDPLGGAADRRRWPLAGSGTSLYWAGLNKGKESVTLDFSDSRGRTLVHSLVASAPAGTAVVLTNAVGRAWLSYETLAALKPDLIHVQVQGASDGSPAVDYTVNAGVGFPLVTGPQALADPVNHVLPAWDIACGLYAALGVTAAHVGRLRTGRGEQVTVALADVALGMAGNLGFLAEAQVNGVQRRRIGNYLYGGFARDFVCADGARVMVVALTPRHWRDLLNVTEMHAPVAALEHSLSADFSCEDDRFEYREVLAGLFERWFRSLPEAAVLERLSKTGLLWSQYRTFAQAVEDIQRSPNALMSVIDQPGVGKHLAPGSPVRLHSCPGEAVPAPVIGGDGATVLGRELDLPAAQIAKLVEDGVLAVPGWSPTPLP